MAILRDGLVLLVALQHVGFLVLEAFLWTGPTGRKIFRTTPEFAQASAALAKNQGLYNGFLAAGLLWGTFHPVPTVGAQIQIFFLACVVVAGIVGALTVSGRILVVQAIPAALALALVFLA